MGSDYKNDVNQVKKSHNIIKNRKCGNVEKLGLNQRRVTDSNINIMKTDSYNFLLGCIFLINFFALVGLFFYFTSTMKNYNQINDKKFEIIIEAIANKK